MAGIQGQDSPRLNLYYLSLWLALFQSTILLVEKTVIVELGEFWPRSLLFTNQNEEKNIKHFKILLSPQNLSVPKLIGNNLSDETTKTHI